MSIDVGVNEDPNEIRAFWTVAKRKARLDSMPGYFGPTVIGSVPPPAFAMSDDAATSTHLTHLILSGEKTATASSAEDYSADGVALPEPGTLGIVLDGEGHPRALIATQSVQVVRFDQVSEEHAAAEGEGDGSLAEWRRVTEEFLTRIDPHGRGFRPDMPLVLERFKRVYPKRPE